MVIKEYSQVKNLKSKQKTLLRNVSISVGSLLCKINIGKSNILSNWGFVVIWLKTWNSTTGGSILSKIIFSILKATTEF